MDLKAVSVSTSGDGTLTFTMSLADLSQAAQAAAEVGGNPTYVVTWQEEHCNCTAAAGRDPEGGRLIVRIVDRDLDVQGFAPARTQHRAADGPHDDGCQQRGNGAESEPALHAGRAPAGRVAIRPRTNAAPIANTTSARPMRDRSAGGVAGAGGRGETNPAATIEGVSLPLASTARSNVNRSASASIATWVSHADEGTQT